MSSDELNDVRMALGAIQASLRSVHEKVDDLTAKHATFTKLAELVDEVEAAIDELPEAMAKVAEDATLGMFVGPLLSPLVEGLTAAQTKLRAKREAPAIESRPE